jgi:hypothetical protein
MAKEKDFQSIRSHSFIETGVVVVLALCGRLAEDNETLKVLFGQHKNYQLLVIFLVVVLLTLLFLFLLNWYFATRQIRFGTAGEIEGAWLDAIYDEEGKLVMGSFVDEMKCSPIDGFYVYGHSYNVHLDNGRVIVEEPEADNFFEGHGAPWRFGNGCDYHYEGKEHRPDEGSGYYKFFRGSRKKVPSFEGGFLSRSLTSGKVISARLVVGKKIKGKAKDCETDEQKIALLEQYLQTCPKEYPREKRETDKDAKSVIARSKQS